MTHYDFNLTINRKGSGDIKNEWLKKLWGREDLIPLWVADMDFATPPFILDALKQRLEHPILGYTGIPQEYYPSIIQWVKDHHQWAIKKEWIAYIPGIVKGIGFAINALLKQDEKVIIQPPVYHPFRITTEANGHEVVNNPLKRIENGTYEMDFDNLAEVYDEKCRMLILCNPHNPGGICWPESTLKRLADFCHERNIIVISDEIHADMALFDNKHIPFATVSNEAANISITFQAPTKTFNIAGVVSSYAIVPNDDLRDKYYGWLRANELDAPALFAPIATIAAFTEGEEWRKQMLDYVEQNIIFVEDYCRQHIPQIKPMRPQASFLIWLDCQDLNLTHEELKDFFTNQARLALNDGETFGKEGSGFMRINVGTPRSILEQAMEQLAKAMKEHIKR
ncbi:MAG: PatB family C-S lyase [Prevotellaceae bacterium]|nr:PatB family C-S lyase [Prevotellaceae bacterium]MDY3365755.1 PatB family C-S lyase [Prevotella sp.]